MRSEAGMRGLLRRTAELAAEGKAEGGEGDREAGGGRKGVGRTALRAAGGR